MFVKQRRTLYRLTSAHVFYFFKSVMILEKWIPLHIYTERGHLPFEVNIINIFIECIKSINIFMSAKNEQAELVENLLPNYLPCIICVHFYFEQK